jgi:hypothetical protein
LLDLLALAHRNVRLKRVVEVAEQSKKIKDGCTIKGNQNNGTWR